jgi:hypothetical protein
MLSAAALLATGCAAPIATAPSASTSPTVVAVDDVTPETVTGEGPTGWPGVAFPIPSDFRSVTIDFSCDGDGFYTVELGDSMMLAQAPLDGTCGENTLLQWPLTPRTGSTLSVTVGDGVAWTATPRFSVEEFPFDAALTTECAAFTDVYSAFINADSGFMHYDAFDATEWAERIAKASAQLREFAASSSSALAAPLSAMVDITAEQSDPGTALVGTDEAVTQIAAACDANQTPFVVKAEFGG